jgi:hypothetical protein
MREVLPLFRQVPGLLHQGDFFGHAGFDADAVRQRVTERIHVDEGDEAADHDLVFDFGLNVGDQAGLSGADDAAFEADDLPEMHRAGEGHTVDFETDDVCWVGQTGGGNETRFNKPFGGAPGIQRAVVVQVFTFNQVVGNTGGDFHTTIIQLTFETPINLLMDKQYGQDFFLSLSCISCASM